MKIINSNPPNIDLILASDLKPNEDTVFCYGKTIYNPSGNKILPDIEHHEEVHSKQQKGNIDGWYYKYITDKEFRLKQELEAYGSQYKFLKGLVPDKKLLKWRLEKMAEALSSESYGNLLSYGEAESKIRNYAKH